MDEALLSVKEVARLRGCSERYVRSLIEKGELTALKVPDETRAGKYRYAVPADALPEKLRLRYKRRQRSERPEPGAEAATEAEPERLTGAERGEITFWEGLLDEWRLYREACGLPKGEADEAFIAVCGSRYPEISLTRGMLYRKERLRSERGRLALRDGRGRHGAHASKLTPLVWELFEARYLTQHKRSVQLCFTLTRLDLEAMVNAGEIPELPEIPSVGTFAGRVKLIPRPYILYFREGKKEFIGKCAPYIRRTYEDIEPNDIWVADNYTFDVAVSDGSGGTMRLYLTALAGVLNRLSLA